MTAINGKPVTVNSITKITPGKHTIDFKYSIYRGPYIVHSYVRRTFTFTAEAGHRYRLFTDCYTMGSSQCSSWIENETANVVVAGKLPRWADLDLATRSEDAAKLRERQALFEEQLASVCAGDRPASQVALYFLAGIAPLGENDLRVEETKSGDRKGPEALSRGTKEQLYLSMRLALAATYAKQLVALPLVADDILVNFDDARAAVTAALLGDYAAEGHQILAFTCHRRLADVFADQAPNARVVELPKPA